MRLGIMELWRQSRKLGDEGLEEIASVILNYASFARIFNSYEVLDGRSEDMGMTLNRGCIFDFNYNPNYHDKFPNILALLAIKEDKGIDVLCVVNKSKDLFFAGPYNITDSPDGRSHREVGIVFANLFEDSIANNLILHEIGHALGLKHYPSCSRIPYCVEHKAQECEYYGHIMCREGNSNGLHEMDVRILSHLL